MQYTRVMPTSDAMIETRKAANIVAPFQVCRTCLVEKPETEFRRNWRRESCLDFNCHPCVSDINRLARFGLLPLQYQEMLAAQGNVCAICERPERSTDKKGRVKALAVDHDHETGAVRGLLCANCNKGIGNLGDNVDTLIAAAAYLAAARGGE